jgi:hypothetical protein
MIADIENIRWSFLFFDYLMISDKQKNVIIILIEVRNNSNIIFDNIIIKKKKKFNIFL